MRKSRFLALMLMSCLCSYVISEKSFAEEEARVARPRYALSCILEVVAKRMNIELRKDVPAPHVSYSSASSLKEYQDKIEPLWGWRPNSFLNAYLWETNEIYLIDDAAYFERVNRAIDDSLAHEFVHFLQIKYRNSDLSGADHLEVEAVEYQEWFRENFIKQAPGAEAPDCLKTQSVSN